MNSTDASSTTDLDPGEPRAALTDDTANKLLSAIEQVRTEARERDEKNNEARERDQKLNEARFERIEEQLGDVAGKTETNTKNIGEQADALTRVASAAAKAVDFALEAKKHASQAADDAAKIVESALRIHGTSIAVTVDESVKKAIAPLVAEVDALKTSDGDQNAKLAGVETKIDGIADSIGTIATGVASLTKWSNRWWVKAIIGLAIFAGASAGSFYVATTNAKTQHTAPDAPR